MRSIIITIFLLLVFSMNALSQAGDFVVIKKRGQSYKTFLKGAYVRFFTSDGDFVETYILDVRNDSVFFKPIILRQVPTPWGVTNLDTVYTTVRSIHYKDIIAIPRKNESFSYLKNGTLLMLGGAGYILLNLVNGAYLNDPPFSRENRPGMAAASGVLASGFVMSKLHKPVLQMGKKYTVHYINLTSSKP